MTGNSPVQLQNHIQLIQAAPGTFAVYLKHDKQEQKALLESELLTLA